MGNRERMRVLAPPEKVELLRKVSAAVGQKVSIPIPRGMTPLDVAAILVGPHVLLKAQPKYGERAFLRHPAMQGLNAEVTAAYEALLAKMLKEIRLFVEDHVLSGAPLRKGDDWREGMYGFAGDVDWPTDEHTAQQEDPSDSPYSVKRLFGERVFSLLTPTQLERVKEIIRDYHDAFAVGVLGSDVIPAKAVQRLIDEGILPQDLAYVWQPAPHEKPPKSMRFTDDTYIYGAYLGQEHQSPVRQMTYSQLEEHTQQKPPSLTPVERQAMAWARHNAGQYIRGMGDRISLATGTLIAQEDANQRKRYLGVVRKELEENIDKRRTWRDLGSRIGHETGDWSRDLQRLAATEQQWAMQEAAARAMAKKDDPENVRVSKIPNPGACPDCIRLHLTAGPGSTPRIFKLADLMGNGSNVGRKRAGWKAVVGTTHPWCGCDLQRIPDGWGYDEDGDLVPQAMLKAEAPAERPHMTHRGAVPEHGCTIRIGDPKMRAVVEAVVASAPSEIFHKDVGVTLITTDIPRVQNPLDENDFAYWTSNEIRLLQTLPIERVPRVIRHELGHSLNVHLMKKLGDVSKVRAWHDELWRVSLKEGFVSEYASKLPIENAAEATRMYLFEKETLRASWPAQFRFLDDSYRDVFR